MISWLCASEDPRRLAAVRIGLCAVLAARLTRTVYVHLSDQPDVSFRPLSFMQLLPGQPPRTAVIVLQAVGGTACVLAMLGARTRFTLPLGWGVGVFLGGMTTSIGKVVHNDVLLLLAMVPLLVAPCADAWAIDARGRAARQSSAAYGLAVRSSMVVVAGAYFFAGFWKLVESGPAWVTSGNMRWVLYASSDSQVTPSRLALTIADQAWLTHWIALFVLLVEIAFPVVLLVKRARAPFLVATIALHAGIWATMRLDYWAQAATVIVVLTDWPSLIERLRARAPAAA